MCKPAIYACVFPEEGTTPEEQVERCLQQAARSGLVISPERIFLDDGYPKRPAMTRLRKAVAAGEVDCILVDKVNRISRNIRDAVHLVVEEWGREHHAVLWSVTEDFTTSSPLGERIFAILTSFADSERDESHHRTESGRRRRFSEGCRAVGDSPFGYARGEGNGTMVIQPLKAEVVRKVFRLYLQGHGFMKIACLLNAEGHCTGKGKQWTDKTVRDVAINEVYIGRVKYGGEYRPGHHQPIIDEATFAAVQNVRRTRERVGGRSVGSLFLLSGLVRCKGCGHLLYTQPATESKRTRKDGRFYTTQNQAYYQCGGRLKKGAAFCRCGHIQQELLEAHVVQRLRARFGQQVASEREALLRTRPDSNWLQEMIGQVDQWELLSHEVRKQLVHYLIDGIQVWRTSLGKGRFKQEPEIEVDIVWNRSEKALPEGDLPWVELEQEMPV